MTSKGNVNFAMFVATCVSTVSGSLDSIYSGTNFAAAASLRNNVSGKQISIEGSLLGGTQRSSHSVTVTRLQSNICNDNCERKFRGVEPPDSPISAVPRASIAARRFAAIISANVFDSVASSANV